MFHPAKDFATENAAHVTLGGMRWWHRAPGAEEVAAAIKASLVDLHREFPETLKRATIARAVLMAARDMAEPGDAKTLTILIEADGPRTRCAMGCESSAEDVLFRADELRAVVRMWEDEAERVLGEVA